MKIINVDEKHEFSSWDEVIEISRFKNVHSSSVTNEQMMEAVKTIRDKAHTSFFRQVDFTHITSLINQFRHYKTNSKYEYSFVDDLFKISKQIKELQGIPGSNALFRLGIFTNFGVFSQFLVTVWLKKFFNIANMETRHHSVDSDITIEIEKNEIHIQVKDIREKQRRSRQEHAIYIIDAVLANRAREAGKTQRLALEKFDGIPPSGLSEKFWEDIANNLVEKPQDKIIQIKPGDGGRNQETIEFSMRFDFRKYSGTFEHSAQGFNNTLILQRMFNELNEELSQYAPHPFFLIAITEDTYNWDKLKQEITSDNLGILILDIFDNEITRSPLLMPDNYEEIEKVFNSLVPKTYHI